MIEIYIKYRQLFGESYDSDKYAMTPTRLCSTGYNLFEDGAVENHLDVIPFNGDGSGSSDEGDVRTGSTSMSTSNAKSYEKR